MWSGLRIVGSEDMRQKTYDIMVDPASATEDDVAWLAAKSIALERLVQVWADVKPGTSVVLVNIGGPGGRLISYTAPDLTMDELTELMTKATAEAMAIVDIVRDQIEAGMEE